MSRVLAATATAVAAGMTFGAAPSTVGARPVVHSLPTDVPLVPGVVSSVGDHLAAMPSISGDGRYVVNHGAVDEAPPAPTDGAADDETDAVRRSVFLTDRQTGETTDLVVLAEGVRAGDTVLPVISGDGCVVVVVTEIALDVFRDDDGGERWDVYRRKLPHCGGQGDAWELVSTRSEGIARDDVVVQRPTISRSGGLVAYTHPADHLYEWEGITSISLVDLTVPVNAASRTRLVAGAPIDIPDTVFTHRGLDQPSLSDDGSHLAYRSDATSADAVPGWGTGPVEGGPATPQVFVWRIAEPDPFLAVDLVSSSPDGSPSAAGAGEPSLSRDGAMVAFTSSDRGMAAARYPQCETNCPTQVFVAERDTDDDGSIDQGTRPGIRLVSARVAGDGSGELVAGVARSSQPTVAGDGDLVAFVTKSTELQLIQAPAVGAGDDGEILLATLSRGRLDRLTSDAEGVVPTAGVHAHPDLDDTGRAVAFDTDAGGELIGDPAYTGRRVVVRTSPPRLSLEGADLGTTLVGVESDEWYVAVINDGPATFRPVDAVVDDDEFIINRDSPQNTCLLGAAVPAGGSCTVAIRYKPSSPGSDTATLTVFEEGFGAVSTTGSLSGAGGLPSLRILDAGLDFGTVEVGESSIEKLFDVTNVSVIATRVTSFEITGDHADDFTFTANACSDRPLNPRAACSVGITFTPSEAGRRTAILELATRTGQYTTAIIAGDGQFSPQVTLGSSEVEAGDQLWASGTNYPPNSEVTVVFGDGPSDAVRVPTDEKGAFIAPIPVGPDERGGSRRIVVQSDSGAAASAPVDVIQAPQQQQVVGLPGFGLG